MTTQINELASELAHRFEELPYANIIRSLPGRGLALGDRMLGEFGDAPARCADASPQELRHHLAGDVSRRQAPAAGGPAGGNRRLGKACLRWAFCAFQTSPGARHSYDTMRARAKTHGQVRRPGANLLVGVLHSCLEKRVAYARR